MVVVNSTPTCKTVLLISHYANIHAFTSRVGIMGGGMRSSNQFLMQECVLGVQENEKGLNSHNVSTGVKHE